MLDVGNILKQFQAEGEPWRQFVSDVQGHRHPWRELLLKQDITEEDQGGSGGNPYKVPERNKDLN